MMVKAQRPLTRLHPRMVVAAEVVIISVGELGDGPNPNVLRQPSAVFSVEF